MKIEITNIDGIIVDFKCAVGNACATWKSSNIIAEVGKSYNIEFAINDIVEIGINAEFSKDYEYRIFGKNNFILLNCFIESIEKDGVLFFRLGDDCLAMAESLISETQSESWVTFKINSKDFFIYPY